MSNQVYIFTFVLQNCAQFNDWAIVYICLLCNDIDKVLSTSFLFKKFLCREETKNWIEILISLYILQIIKMCLFKFPIVNNNGFVYWEKVVSKNMYTRMSINLLVICTNNVLNSKHANKHFFFVSKHAIESCPSFFGVNSSFLPTIEKITFL